MIFLYLFYTFCKIGLFGFGGGYAMLSMIPVSYTHLDVYKRQGLGGGSVSSVETGRYSSGIELNAVQRRCV